MKGMNLGNMQGMMKQMQKMQKDLKKEQQEIEETIFEAKSANDLVTVKINGKREVIDLVIDETLVDPDDIEMLQDLVITTLNEALQDVEKTTEARLGRFTQGMNLPF